MADFEVISEVTLGSSTSQWVIADISQDYTHLELDLHLRATTVNNGTYPGGMTFNTFTGSNHYGYGVYILTIVTMGVLLMWDLMV